MSRKYNNNNDKVYEFKMYACSVREREWYVWREYTTNKYSTDLSFLRYGLNFIHICKKI